MKTFLYSVIFILVWAIISLVLQKRGKKSMGSHSLIGKPENIKAAAKELDNKGIFNLWGYKETVLAINPKRREMGAIERVCQEFELELKKDIPKNKTS